MFKKIAFFVFIGVTLVVAYYGYNRLKLSKEPNVVVTEHISETALCVIETKQCKELITQFTRQNLIWKALVGSETIKNTHAAIHYFDSVTFSNTLLEDMLKGNSVFLSFIKNGNQTQSLIQFKLKEQNDDKLVTSFFEASFKKSSSISSFKAYNFTINTESWLACLVDGIVYFSQDSELLQNSVNLNKEKSLSNYKPYINLLKLNGKQNTQIYYNHKLAHLFDKSVLTQQSVFSTHIELNEITLNGYTLPDSVSFLTHLKQQNANELGHFNDYPNNPISFINLSISNAKQFVSEIEHAGKNNQFNTRASLWQELNDSALYNIQNDYLENIDDELVYASYLINGVVSKIQSIKIKDEENATQLIALLTDSSFTINDTRFVCINPKYSKLFSYVNTQLECKCALIKNNALFLFESKDAAVFFANHDFSKNVLGKNDEFTKYANANFNNSCNFIYYENTEQIKASNQPSFLNSQLITESINPFSKLSFTAKNYTNQLQFRLNVFHASSDTGSVQSTTKSVWSFDAQSDITSDVSTFTNHNTQENELCFQTADKNLQLIDATGNLIWKKIINESIQSAVFTVDIFKNGKFQLLFNTDNYLHLIDRNGVYVQGFPVKLPAKATSPITLLDYDNAKDYRLFIACADKKIYNFSLYGIKTEGFVPVKTEAIVNAPVYYTKVGASDYLTCFDTEGKLYVFSRKGEGRIDFKNKTISNLNQANIQAGNSIDNTKLFYLDDKNNLVNKISFSDKKETLKIGDELNGFESKFALIDDDTQQDILVYGNGAVYGYDLFSNKLFEYFDNQSVYAFADIVETNAHTCLLATDTISKKIDVITTDGKLLTTLKPASRKPLVHKLYKNEKVYALVVSGSIINCIELD